ncbi:hypothetical protein O181_050134 [Austropuccinia psidii MF-1]|uniref:Uncharacterized protein n=1 Tax=Austropuccinia psidii MF-1 TaxID=1389203 RepID=A0A9Q3DW98_9BASI|nr:hypothetical protein [Austropuccinia psidii MF-1]
MVSKSFAFQNHHQPPPQHQYSNQMHHYIPLKADSTIKPHDQSNLLQASFNFLKLSSLLFNNQIKIKMIHYPQNHLNQASSKLLFPLLYLVFTS